MATPSDPCTVKVSARPGRGFFQTLARWWWLELLLLITLPCAFGFLALAAVAKRTPMYESAVVVEVNPPAGELRTHLQTECGIIRSRPCLTLVVKRLELTAKWGLSPEDAADKLKSRINARPLGDSFLLRISARAEDPTTARDLATELALAYILTQNENTMARANAELNELKRQIRIQEDTVEQSRKLLAQIARARGIAIPNPLQAIPPPPDAALDPLRAKMAGLEILQATLESRIKALEKGSLEVLLAEAEAANPPKADIAAAYASLTDTLADLKQLGTPADDAAKERSRALEDRIASLRESLQRKSVLLLAPLRGALTSLKAERETLRHQLDSHTRSLIVDSLAATEYQGALGDYRRELELLEDLMRRLFDSEISAKLKVAPAVLREEAVPAARPVNQHPRREIAGAAFVGFVLAFVGMIPLALLLEGFSANRRLRKAAVAP